MKGAELALKILQAEGWHVSLLSPETARATGFAAAGWREGWPVRRWRCPECGEEVLPAPYEVAGGTGMTTAWGYACPLCGRLGLLEELPQERQVQSRAWTGEELSEVVRRYRLRPPAASRGEEEERLAAWGRKALEEALDRVRSAPQGARNVTLAREAARVGGILRRTGVISLEEALERLVEAARVAGVPPHEARSTAERQLRWGYERGR